MTLSAYSLVQPAVVVWDIHAGVDRVYELFRAVPSERNTRADFVNAVYAFDGYTYLEVLDGLREGHTRTRFLDEFGPGLYMLCVDLANDDPEEVERDLAAAGIRVVAPGRRTENITAGWHLHPRDAGNILVLHAIKKDRTDNTDWAGHREDDYVPGNSRVVGQLMGVIARTADPAAEAPVFSKLGFPMSDVGHGGYRWSGPTGTMIELRTAGAWAGEPVDRRRDYALCFATEDNDRSIAHFASCGLGGRFEAGIGRWLSDVDPVLGVRIALEDAAR